MDGYIDMSDSNRIHSNGKRCDFCYSFKRKRLFSCPDCLICAECVLTAIKLLPEDEKNPTKYKLVDDNNYQEDDWLYCSFCGKKSHQVPRLFAGHNEHYICNECVLKAYAILLKEQSENNL